MTDQHDAASVYADATAMTGSGDAMIELESVDKFFGSFRRFATSTSRSRARRSWW